MTVFYLITLLIFILYLIFEYVMLQSRIHKIPLRILVNGTRGKSTTVKIIHKILQESGKKVLAKTTGDVPQLIFPDGSQKKVKRSAPASIIENIRILKKAAKANPDAVVLECMALQPETQRVLSHFIFKPNYTIITNIHPDHFEVMGPDITDTAHSISECFSKDSSIILTKGTMQLLSRVPRRHAGMHQAENEEFPVHFKNIPHQIINENWAVISTLAGKLNLDKKTTEQCFTDAWKSIDQRISYLLPNQNAEFWNLFSANDSHTSDSFMRKRLGENSFDRNLLCYLNCRADRPLRTKEFVNLILGKYSQAEIWLIGDGKHLAKNIFRNHAMDIKLISDQQAVQNIKSGFSRETLLFCLGNFKGMESFISEIDSLAENHSEVKTVL